MKETSSIYDYLSDTEVAQLKNFIKDKETPFVVLDLKRIAQNYHDLKTNLPIAKIYYAAKANPHPEVIKLLYNKGSNFDVASIYEIDQLLALGIPPERMSYGNTIKKAEHIAYAYKKGIRIFATDSFSDVDKIAANAPGSKVLFRILLEGGNADWPLSKKFGAHPDLVYKLIIETNKKNLIPYGLSFHVGSQQRDIGQWDNAIAFCKYIMDGLKTEGIRLQALNLGGGFPTKYVHKTRTLSEYCSSIMQFLREDFGNEIPEIMIEPGRSMVGNAGVLVSQIIMVSQKSFTDENKWVFIDAGKFNGLIETLDEAIKYPIFWEHAQPNEQNTEKVILAGPTCDSADIMYERYQYKFPASIKEGDKLLILSIGAYSTSYCSVSFNGFPPLTTYLLDENSQEQKTLPGITE